MNAPGPIFPVQNFIASAYAAPLISVPVSLLSRGGITTNDGQVLGAGHQSKSVQTVFDWINTYPGQAVTINLATQSQAAAPLDKIVMVYVDNELNSQNVTIYFPDTQQFLGVPAFTTGYYPVLTGMFVATVYNGLTGKVPVTSQSLTSILFCNFAVPGFLSQETLNVTFESSTGSRVPVLGDTTVAGQYSLLTSTAPLVFLPALTLPLQYVITDITLTGAGLFTDSTTNGNFLEIQLSDPATTKLIRQYNYFLGPSIPPGGVSYVPITQLSGLNIPVQALALFCTLPGGVPPTVSNGFITFDVAFATVSL
jgi:hypothetical protein